MEEVRYYVQDFINTGIIPAVDGGVIKSDNCIDALLRRDLQEAVSLIKRTRSTRRKELSHRIDAVVDPFLYPFCWEKTKIVRSEQVSREDWISKCNEGRTEKMPPEKDCCQTEFIKYRNDMAWSRRYQWLPFDVTFGANAQGFTQ